MFAWKNHGRGLGRIDGWWNEFHRRVIEREISRVLVLNLSGKVAVLIALPRITMPLTEPSLLSRGTRVNYRYIREHGWATRPHGWLRFWGALCHTGPPINLVCQTLVLWA